MLEFATSSTVTDLISAILSATHRTNAGSFLLPLLGCGDKNGASVSISILVNGKPDTMSLKLYYLLKVIDPVTPM